MAVKPEHASESLKGLSAQKLQILNPRYSTQYDRGGALEPSVLTSSQVLLLLTGWGPHLRAPRLQYPSTAKTRPWGERELWKYEVPPLSWKNATFRAEVRSAMLKNTEGVFKEVLEEFPEKEGLWQEEQMNGKTGLQYYAVNKVYV